MEPGSRATRLRPRIEHNIPRLGGVHTASSTEGKGKAKGMNGAIVFFPPYHTHTLLYVDGPYVRAAPPRVLPPEPGIAWFRLLLRRKLHLACATRSISPVLITRTVFCGEAGSTDVLDICGCALRVTAASDAPGFLTCSGGGSRKCVQ
jgi:hypothetical protein